MKDNSYEEAIRGGNIQTILRQSREKFGGSR